MRVVLELVVPINRNICSESGWDSQWCKLLEVYHFDLELTWNEGISFRKKIFVTYLGYKGVHMLSTQALHFRHQQER